MEKDFPHLDFTNKRPREFKSHSEEQRAGSIYLYLVEGLSYREIDRTLQLLDSRIDSKGFQSFNICQFVGLTKEHKGFFKGKTPIEILSYLHPLTDNPDIFLIYYYLQLHMKSFSSLTESNLFYQETSDVVGEIKGKTWVRSSLLFDKKEHEYDDALRHADRVIERSSRVYVSDPYLKESIKCLYDYKCQICVNILI